MLLVLIYNVVEYVFPTLKLIVCVSSFGGEQAGMPYDFQWEVKAPEFKNDYSQQQSSDGRVTQGEYRVLLPDSRVQIVRFTVSFFKSTI
jgi:hypothetical protein